MYGKRPMMLLDPNEMLQGLRGQNAQADPRSQAIEQLMQQGQVQRPGMKTEQDYRQQFNGENPDFTPTRPRMPGLPEYDGKPTPGEQEEHDQAAQMSDEDILAQMHQQMGPAQGPNPMDNDVTDQANWPDTPEEFTKKFGREPTTDSEVEFYYGPPGDDREMEQDPPTNERDMQSGRG